MVGAEPAQADDAAQSFQAGRIVTTVANTIADGLRTSLGDRTFPLIQALVDDIATATEAGIVSAMYRIGEIMKIVVEPSGAVGFAVVREHATRFAGLRVGVILSGGNVDLRALPGSAGS